LLAIFFAKAPPQSMWGQPADSVYRKRYATNLRREPPRIPFVGCHPEAAESHAQQATPNEGPVQLVRATGAVGASIDSSAHKERGPQDDKQVFKALRRQAIAWPKSTSTANSSRIPSTANFISGRNP
jgi:hypothetical protein